MDVINQDQSTFLPFRFILNNILLTHETISWAKRSKQPLAFLKLNFSKAYDRMNWSFLFGCMKNLGIPVEFINMTNLFSKKLTFASVVIDKGVQRGCPLVPYLFLIVGEMRNAMVHEDLRYGKIQRVQLPRFEKQ
jgi:hypothetical protein